MSLKDKMVSNQRRNAVFSAMGFKPNKVYVSSVPKMPNKAGPVIHKRPMVIPSPDFKPNSAKPMVKDVTVFVPKGTTVKMREFTRKEPKVNKYVIRANRKR